MSDDKAKQSKEKKRKEKFSYLLSDWDEKLFYIGQRQLLVLGTRSLFDMLIFIWKLVKHLVVWAVANFSQVPCTLYNTRTFFLDETRVIFPFLLFNLKWFILKVHFLFAGFQLKTLTVIHSSLILQIWMNLNEKKILPPLRFFPCNKMKMKRRTGEVDDKWWAWTSSVR